MTELQTQEIETTTADKPTWLELPGDEPEMVWTRRAESPTAVVQQARRLGKPLPNTVHVYQTENDANYPSEGLLKGHAVVVCRISIVEVRRSAIEYGRKGPIILLHHDGQEWRESKRWAVGDGR